MSVKKKKSVPVKKKAAPKKKKQASARKVTVNVNVNVTQTPKKIKKNYLMMVLDESGSMISMREQAISAFNEQLISARQSRGDIDVRVGLVKFEGITKDVHVNKPLDQVEPLTHATYVPCGGTAMYDGVGRAIELLNQQPDIKDEDVTVLMLIISDGEENSSKFYKSEVISELAKGLQATGRWTFTYAGANQDITKIQKTFHMPMGNVTSFQASAAGMSANNSMRSAGTNSYYKSQTFGTQSVSNFYAQPGTEGGLGQTVDTTVNPDPNAPKTP
jgi:uncharacterized protein YegL